MSRWIFVISMCNPLSSCIDMYKQSYREVNYAFDLFGNMFFDLFSVDCIVYKSHSGKYS